MSELIDRKHIVYQLRASDEDREFYIGKSYEGSRRLKDHIKPSQLRNGTRKSNKIKSILSRGAQIICEVLSVVDTEDLALGEEVRLISEKGRLSDGSGYLTNGTDGGEGTTGRGQSTTARVKISNGLRVFFDKSEDIVPTSVFRMDGTFVAVYKNKDLTGKALGISPCDICAVISGKSNSVKSSGIRYRFLNGVWLDRITPRPEGRVYLGVKVLQYSISGELIGVYANSECASRITGISARRILRSISRLPGKPSTGIWAYDRYGVEGYDGLLWSHPYRERL